MAERYPRGPCLSPDPSNGPDCPPLATLVGVLNPKVLDGVAEMVTRPHRQAGMKWSLTGAQPAETAAREMSANPRGVREGAASSTTFARKSYMLSHTRKMQGKKGAR